MLKILQLIGGFFVSGGAISSFFAWIGVKLASKSVIVGLQIARIVALAGSYVAFLLSVLTFTTKVLNYINTFLQNMPSYFNSDSILSLAFKILQSLGVIDAFNDAFSIFNILFTALLSAWLLKFSFKIYKLLSDEFYKLGSLLQA